MKPLRVGTTNAGKLREFRAILAPYGFDVRGFDGLPALNVVEDGATFEANALKKAIALLAATGEPAVADDSGLVVDALDGAPGVHSARYAGLDSPNRDLANRRKLLAALADVPAEKRAARFVCALAYCTPDREPRFFRGVLEGRIALAERGENGFGYDPIFEIPQYGRTAAEVSAAEKNAVSHRGQALRALAAFFAKEGK